MPWCWSVGRSPWPRQRRLTWPWRLVRARAGLAWCGTGRAGEAELGQSGGGGRMGPGWFRYGRCGGCSGPAGWPGSGTEVAGGAEGRGGLGGALLGLAQFGDGFGQGGEADQQHDRGECAVLGQVGVGADQPGGVAELVPTGVGTDMRPQGWRAARS
jgi:hypothetical protein